MLEKAQHHQQLSCLLVIIVVVLGLLYYLYHRKNKLYLRIVLQNQEAIKRESDLNRQIEELQNKENTPEKYASSSRIINEQAQTSFTHYVNRFRIEEAIRLLSDPSNDTPLKALASDLGFNSISTFYNLFQSSVGMTPAQYRSKVKELEKSR